MKAGVLALLLLGPLLAGCSTTKPDISPRSAIGEPDPTRLLDLVKAQVLKDDGSPRYRIPGTADSLVTATFLRDRLTAAGATASFHNFTAAFRCDGMLAMRNVVGEMRGERNATIYLGAHYDSRPVATKDPEILKQTQPVLGANDGGSGVAVVLELARLLGALESRQYTYRFVLFDGEDGGSESAAEGCNGKWTLGSTAYARSLSEKEEQDARVLLLFDMVGDKDLVLQKEGWTAAGAARDVQSRLWEIGGGLGYRGIFLNVTGPSITDDHVPFVQRGIPAVDVIHLDGTGRDIFPDSHHTTFDDLEHLSPASMLAVARTAAHWLAEMEAGAG